MEDILRTMRETRQLTQHDAGILLIKDFVARQEDGLNGKDPYGPLGFLTEAERQGLIRCFKEAESYEYLAVLKYLEKSILRFAISAFRAEALCWKVHYHLQLVDSAEQGLRYVKQLPRVMTQKQYEELKKEAFEAKMASTMSVEELLSYALYHYLYCYKENKETPLNKHFEAAKEKPITNPRLKNHYYDGGTWLRILPDGRKHTDYSAEEWERISAPYKSPRTLDFLAMGFGQLARFILKPSWEEQWDHSAPDTETMFNVIEYFDEHYCSAKTGSGDTLWEFMNDLPELYAALWNELTAIEDLAYLKDVPKEKFFDTQVVAVATLYKNNVSGKKGALDSIEPEGCHRGVAILQSGRFYHHGHIDEKGYWQDPIPYTLRMFSHQEFWPKHKDIIAKLLDDYKRAMRDLLAVGIAVALVGDFIEIPEVESVFGEPGPLYYPSVYLDSLIQELSASYDENNDPFGLRELLRPITQEDLLPTAQSIEKVREMIDFKVFMEEPQRIVEILLEKE